MPYRKKKTGFACIQYHNMYHNRYIFAETLYIGNLVTNFIRVNLNVQLYFGTGSSTYILGNIYILQFT